MASGRVGAAGIEIGDPTPSVESSLSVATKKRVALSGLHNRKEPNMAAWNEENDEQFEHAMDAQWSLSLIPLAVRGLPLADFEPALRLDPDGLTVEASEPL